VGKGSRPAKAKTIVLTPGIGGSSDKVQGVAAVVVAEVEQQSAPVTPKPILAWAEPPSTPPSEPGPQQQIFLEATPPPAATTTAPAPDPVPAYLATLKASKEELRQQHPDRYPDFRDTFGNQLTEKLLPTELAKLSAAELGLPPGLVQSDPIDFAASCGRWPSRAVT
jgi:hypothetical protein